MLVKTIKVSVKNPMCMEIAKDILVELIEKEDNDERNQKRTKKA
jgi:hypothetical protein